MKRPSYICNSPQPSVCLLGQYNAFPRGMGTPCPWRECHHWDISAWLPGAIQVVSNISTAWQGASGFQDAQNILLQLYQSKASIFLLQLKWLNNLISLMHLLLSFEMLIYNNTTSTRTIPLQLSNLCQTQDSRQEPQKPPLLGADFQIWPSAAKQNKGEKPFTQPQQSETTPSSRRTAAKANTAEGGFK